MRNQLILLILTLLTAVNANAQSKKIYSSNFEAYMGTWVYDTDNELFTLILKKGYENSSLFYGDCLVGDYAHAKDGSQLDYTGNIPTTVTDSYYEGVSIPGFFGTNGSSNPGQMRSYVAFYFWDRGFGKRRLNGSLTLLSPTTARFEVWRRDDISGKTHDWVISVPTDVVLTKVVETPPNQPNPPVEPGKPIGWIDFGV